MEEDAERDSEMEEDSESEGEIEYDLSNMEITEELRQFFAETERHREELRKSMLVLCFVVFGAHNIELDGFNIYRFCKNSQI